MVADMTGSPPTTPAFKWGTPSRLTRAWWPAAGEGKLAQGNGPPTPRTGTSGGRSDRDEPGDEAPQAAEQ